VASLLVIDDDPSLRRALEIGLCALGHDVRSAQTGNAGISETALHPPEVVVLDLGLPDIDGVEVCRRIREWTSVPIIVLSADYNEDRKVAALDSGADDYVTKPFGINELDARVRVAMRHAASSDSPQSEDTSELSLGPLCVDLREQSARLNDVPLDLTRREYQLLAFLARHAGKVCTHKMILEAVWGAHSYSDTHYLREYTYRLRRKLGDEHGTFLVTRPGVGYQLVPPDPTAADTAMQSSDRNS
jgi:two-component system, OmpR family, KDP operon response regulator KdpE